MTRLKISYFECANSSLSFSFLNLRFPKKE